jgi:hypothetical protein
MMPADSPIVAFYRSAGCDQSGRLIAEIHRFSNRELEQSHDYIQWLFPLIVRSQFNPNAPILVEADIVLFASDPVLRVNFRRSLEKILGFYGYEIMANNPVQIFESEQWGNRSIKWISDGNHNYLRITRMLRSAYLLGFEEYAQAFLDRLLKLRDSPYGRIIGARTFAFWQKAVPRNE